MKRNLILEELVIKEAINLKKHATKKELEELDYDYLNGESIANCIYGQMTGICYSKRAYDLIKKCAVRVYNTTENDVFDGDLNGPPKKVEPKLRLDSYISPIEKFLYLYKPSSYTESTKIKKLVDFLQDKTQELKF